MTSKRTPEGPLTSWDRAADVWAIRDVVWQYCRAIDRLDMDLLRRCYHPGARDQHTGFDGPVEEFITWVEPGLRRLAGTMHTVANHLVEFATDNPDRALSEAYATAAHWGEPGAPASSNFISGVRYVDLMERRDGEWRILERTAVREYSQRMEQAPRHAPGPSGTRGSDDPLTQMRHLLNR